MKWNITDLIMLGNFNSSGFNWLYNQNDSFSFFEGHNSSIVIREGAKNMCFFANKLKLIECNYFKLLKMRLIIY